MSIRPVLAASFLNSNSHDWASLADGVRLAASSTANDASDGSAASGADDAETGAQTGDDGNVDESGEPNEEFSGSASQAEPDLDSSAEQNLIQNGWK